MLRAMAIPMAILIGFAAPADAQSRDQELAQRLKAQCDDRCSGQRRDAERGSVRATYEAAACLCGCFYKGVPASYPNRAQFKKCNNDNARAAAKLGSNAPVIRD